MFTCRHKYGKVEEDGYQYCNKCGKAIPVDCNHKWDIYKDFDHRDVLRGNIFKKTLIFICKKCGDIKQEKITS